MPLLTPPTNLPEAIAYVLAEASLGVQGIDMLVGYDQPEPDELLVIYEYDAGAPIEVFQAAAPAIDRPRIQLWCRGAREGYADARARLVAARVALSAVVSTTVYGTDTTILRIAPAGSINTLGRDKSDRPQLTANFDIWLKVPGE